MKRTCYILLATFYLPLLLLLGCDSEANKKGDAGSRQSKTVNESKDNGVFEFEVSPNRSNFKLDGGLKLQIKEAWVEKVWSRQHRIFGATPIDKMNTDQLILRINVTSDVQRKNNHHYYFLGHMPIEPGDSLVYFFCGDDSLDYFFCDRIDTIRIPLYRQDIPDLQPEKLTKAYDRLTFVKQITSR